jgi:hypothetical protein
MCVMGPLRSTWLMPGQRAGSLPAAVREVSHEGLTLLRGLIGGVASVLPEPPDAKKPHRGPAVGPGARRFIALNPLPI